ASLVSPPINLAAIRNSALLFDSRYEIEQSFDRLHLEVSTDNKIWNKLEDFTGRSEWSQHLVDLSRYDGQTIRLRFRMESDSSVVRDGFYLDNISVVGDRNI
ncbi:MAG: immune inhibitor A, partial [Candidatus Eremiobacteraeota bacterium]|nr:immune inhibitor A [Candidatus Eremiobacteraeota bacterium]